MNNKTMTGLLIGLILIILIYSSLFVVREGQNALVLRLGELKMQNDQQTLVYGPGLHFKIPLIERVLLIDVRLQNVEAESPRILTKEQKYLYVDYYAKWRIADVALYYKRTGGLAARAQALMMQQINDSLRAQFGKKELHEVVSDDRINIMASLKDSTNQSASGLGIQIIDVRIKSIDLLKEVQESVFQRMRTKREQVATEYRSDGQAQAEKIRSQADANATKMLANANREAALARASGDAAAATIYTSAYTQDPEFYAFYRSLEMYNQVFTRQNSVMLLKPDSEIFKYFQESGGGTALPKPVVSATAVVAKPSIITKKNNETEDR